MQMRLHANATTTPKVREYIRRSPASVAQLAVELGVSETTIRRWRARDSVADRSSRPRAVKTSLSATEEALTVELRRLGRLSLDDIVEVLRRCVNPALSRSAVHRCLARHGVAGRPERDKPAAQPFETDTPAGFVHLDLKHLPALHRQKAYAYVAIDRATRFAHVEILPDRRANTAAGFLQRFLAAFPITVHTVLTDNGSEFTDRFAVDMKGKLPDRPSGHHPIDRLCAERGIAHRLTRPFHPQTNGMVERFNRRLAERLAEPDRQRAGHRRRFHSHEERNTFLLAFVRDYNRTRLRCLGYHAPVGVLNNLTGHNTKAGAQSRHLLER